MPSLLSSPPRHNDELFAAVVRKNILGPFIAAPAIMLGFYNQPALMLPVAGGILEIAEREQCGRNRDNSDITALAIRTYSLKPCDEGLTT